MKFNTKILFFVGVIVISGVFLTRSSQDPVPLSNTPNEIKDKPAPAEIYGTRRNVLQQFCNTHSECYRKGTCKFSAASSMFVHDKYKVMWCDIPKVASTALLWKIANLSGRRVPTDPSIHFPSVLQRFGIRLLSSYSKQEQQLRVKKYYKFLFVRNPILRLQSGYIDKFLAGDVYLHKARASLKAANKYQNQTHFRHIQFNEFIWIITNSSMRSNPHWLPIEHQCHPCGTDYDFIGKKESFDADLQYLLSTRFNVSETNGVKIHKYATSHKTNGTLAKAHERISSLSIVEKRGLYGHLKHDAHMFGYDLGDISKEL